MRSRKVRFVKQAFLVAAGILLWLWALSVRRRYGRPITTICFEQGRIINSTDISNPSTLNLIWVFPRAGSFFDRRYRLHCRRSRCEIPGQPVQYMDGPEPDIRPGIQDAFLVYHRAQRPKRDSYLRHMEVSRRTLLMASIRCCLGAFNLQWWFSFKNSTKGRVRDSRRQRHGDRRHFRSDPGNLRRRLAALTPTVFTFQNGGSNQCRVELSDKTGDTADEFGCRRAKVIVAADAVQFVPSTGQKIYASPASATKTSSTPPG